MYTHKLCYNLGIMAYVVSILLMISQLSALNLVCYPDINPGPYCGINNMCCKDREDRCSHKITIPFRNATMCYCDEFCDRPNGEGDCCCDYLTVCGSNKITTPNPTTKPPTETTPTFIKTTPRPAKSTACIFCNDDNDENCSNHRCMIQDDVIKQVNKDRYLGWRASNYTQFLGKKLKDGLIYKLGTFKRSRALSHLGAERYDNDEPYPTEFNVKVRWPHLISPIADQGWCGSDWAVSLASVVSDRFAVQSMGAEKVRLSPQTLLSCSGKRQKGCKGGHVDTAWRFAQIHGLVDEDCFPYTANKSSCPFKPKGDLLKDGCTPVVPDRKERYKVGPPIRLAHEKDVMHDILHSGPIQAMMKVYQDFFHYKSGIYKHSPYGDQKIKGYHTVRLVGWGEENNQKYWIVANSWGTKWGENGFFRIARGINECEIESFMVSVVCYVTESFLE